MAGLTIENVSSAVVPLAAIVDRLQGKLSAADLNALLLAVVGENRSTVQPGDLITAEFMNQILAQLRDLTTRVAFLEGSVGREGDVVITSLVPSDGSVKVGERLEVLGKNFELTKGLARVFIDRYAVLGFLSESTDERLVLTVPTTINDVPASGRPAILTVSNNKSSTQAVIFLRSAMELAGFFELNEMDSRPSAEMPTANRTFTMEMELASQANLDTVAKITANVTGPSNAADWSRSISILDTREAVIREGDLPIGSGERKRFLVRLQIPQGTALGIAFTLHAQVVSGNVTAKRSVGLTVGTRYAAPDNTVTLNYASSEVRPTGGRGTVNADGIQLPSGGGAKMVLSATFEQEGKYDLTTSVPTGWQAAFTDGTASPLDILASEVANGAKASRLVHFTVGPGASPAGAGELMVTLQRQLQTTARKMSMPITLLT